MERQVGVCSEEVGQGLAYLRYFSAPTICPMQSEGRSLPSYDMLARLRLWYDRPQSSRAPLRIAQLAIQDMQLTLKHLASVTLSSRSNTLTSTSSGNSSNQLRPDGSGVSYGAGFAGGGAIRPKASSAECRRPAGMTCSVSGSGIAGAGTGRRRTRV